MGVSQNVWIMMDTPIKLDDLGAPISGKPPNGSLNTYEAAYCRRRQSNRGEDGLGASKSRARGSNG